MKKDDKTCCHLRIRKKLILFSRNSFLDSWIADSKGIL